MALTEEFVRLRTATTQAGGDILQVLRSALVLANSASDHAAIEWIKAELNGYDDFETVPDYRRLKAPCYVKRFDGALIPFMFEDSEIGERLSVVPFNQPIGAVQTMAKGNGYLEVTFNSKTEAELAKAIPRGFQRPLRTVAHWQLEAVVDAVRNRVLDWCVQNIDQKEEELCKLPAMKELSDIDGTPAGTKQSGNSTLGQALSNHPLLVILGVIGTLLGVLQALGMLRPFSEKDHTVAAVSIKQGEAATLHSGIVVLVERLAGLSVTLSIRAPSKSPTTFVTDQSTSRATPPYEK